MRAAAVFALSLAVSGCHPGRPVIAPRPPDPLEVIPASWIDLPAAPFAARVVEGKAVLVNRGERSLDFVETGCVRQEGSAVRIVGNLFAQSISDGRYAPGDQVEGLIRMINNIDHYIDFYSRSFPELVKRCPADSGIAVIAAGRGREYRWSAAGTPWAR